MWQRICETLPEPLNGPRSGFSVVSRTASPVLAAHEAHPGGERLHSAWVGWSPPSREGRRECAQLAIRATSESVSEPETYPAQDVPWCRGGDFRGA